MNKDESKRTLIIPFTIKVAGPKAKVVDYEETFIFKVAGSVRRSGRKRSHALCLLDEGMPGKFQTFSVVYDSIFNKHSWADKSNWLSNRWLNKMLDQLKFALQQFSEYCYLN